MEARALRAQLSRRRREPRPENLVSLPDPVRRLHARAPRAAPRDPARAHLASAHRASRIGELAIVWMVTEHVAPRPSLRRRVRAKARRLCLGCLGKALLLDAEGFDVVRRAAR